MTHYNELTSMSIEGLARWIETNGKFDDSPWMNRFNKNYCSKCESVTITKAESKEKLGFELMFSEDTTCSYCEVYKKCRFFPNLNETPSCVEIIEMWLKENVDEKLEDKEN